MRQSRGFTLIEVLVASAIFVGVLVIGISSFTSINRLSEQIQHTRQLSQTGNFVMETLVRDIRSATGIKNAAGSFVAQYPFDFVTDPISRTLSLNSSPTSALRIRTCVADPCSSPPIVRLYGPEGDDQFAIWEGSGRPQPLLPDGIGVKDITFSGINHRTLTIQPYVIISFTLFDRTAPDGQQTEQTFQTTVTSLVYAQ